MPMYDVRSSTFTAESVPVGSPISLPIAITKVAHSRVALDIQSVASRRDEARNVSKLIRATTNIAYPVPMAIAKEGRYVQGELREVVDATSSQVIVIVHA